MCSELILDMSTVCFSSCLTPCLSAILASHDPEVQASFQKLKTEHDELESDFVLMSKMEVMTKSLKKNYQVLLAILVGSSV